MSHPKQKCCTYASNIFSAADQCTRIQSNPALKSDGGGQKKADPNSGMTKKSMAAHLEFVGKGSTLCSKQPITALPQPSLASFAPLSRTSIITR